MYRTKTCTVLTSTLNFFVFVSYQVHDYNVAYSTYSSTVNVHIIIRTFILQYCVITLYTANVFNSLSVYVQNPETGGSGGSRFSFKVLTTKLKGGDTSYFGRMSAATRDLQEAEDSAKQAQKDLE